MMTKHYIYAAALCGCLFFLLATPALAAKCAHISCADMGYAQTDVPGCQSYIYCPFDKSFKACAQFANIKKDSCPDGATCESAYMVTGCQDGYDQQTNAGTGAISCEKKAETCTGSTSKTDSNGIYDECTKDGQTLYTLTGCVDGYVKATETKFEGLTITRTTKCMVETCFDDKTIENCSNYINADNGKSMCTACFSGYQPFYSLSLDGSNECSGKVSKCTKKGDTGIGTGTGTGSGSSSSSCADEGLFSTSSEACSKCDNIAHAVTSSGGSRCYTCGTDSNGQKAFCPSTSLIK